MEKRPTIMDIARVAGVSFKTVSRVLNGNSSVGSELRDRVLKASAELNYRPNLAARSLASTRHHAIAMVIGKETMEYASSEGWYLPPFVMDFQARALVACQQRGYRFHIEIVDETSSSLAMQLSAQQLHVDGIILAPPLADSATVMEALEQNALPYVRVSPGLEIDRTSAVMVDEYGGAFAMTEYLLSLGHRRIGFIHGHPDHLAAKRRYVAFHDAMSASQETEELTEIGSFTFAGGWGAAEKLLAREQPPTAIFAANDEMAAGVVAAAFNCGIGVPNGLSVAGFDDSPYARLTPVPLTTVNQPIADMVEATIAMLIGEKGPSGVGDQLRLPCKVIERSSTRPFARS